MLSVPLQEEDGERFLDEETLQVWISAMFHQIHTADFQAHLKCYAKTKCEQRAACTLIPSELCAVPGRGHGNCSAAASVGRIQRYVHGENITHIDRA
jgi:hypothetical protein